MSTIEFAGEELDLLHEILDNSLTSLEVEIHRTDSTEFKQKLNRRYELLKRLSQRIEHPNAVVS